MTLQQSFKYTAFATLLVLGLTACGGGGSSGSGDQPDDPAPPQPMAADFGKTISDLVGPQGSTTLPDGRTYDAESAPIEMSDYMWDIDDTDVDEGPLDDVFSGG